MKDEWMEEEQRPSVGEPKRNGKSSDNYVEKSIGLPDMSEDCIATILSRLPPREVAKTACVCQSFHLVSQFDSIWANMLPHGHMEMLKLITDPKPVFRSKKDILIYLTTPKFFAHGTKAYWIDTATGGVILSMSPRELQFWSDNNPSWIRSENSLFPEVAQLMNASWFGACGEFEVALPPGSYTLSWRIQVKRPSDFGGEPVRFTFGTIGHDGNPEILVMYIGDKPPTIRVIDNHWHEYDVVEFSIDREKPTRMIWVAMFVLLWRSWMSIDGIVIRPTNTIKDL